MNYDLSKLTPDIRKLSDIKNVVYDQKWLKTAGDFNIYYMYRGLEEKDSLRYDITVVPAIMIGKEFNKTKGHFHIGNMQETYTVLEGEAIYLMQKIKEQEVEDVYAVMAKKGDSIIIPPGYGHITINPSKTDELKMANWISCNCKSDYSFFEKMQGACYYYVLQPDSGKAGWIKNKNYKDAPELRFEEPLKSLPENLNFLK